MRSLKISDININYFYYII